MKSSDCQTRLRILQAATQIFADCGYSGTSVQDIVNRARVTKPSLYYHFKSKDELYMTVVNSAHDTRFELMQKAAGSNDTLEKQLEDILGALFRFARKRKDLTRLCFMTAFASPTEIPNQKKFFEKGQRNFQFLHTLIKQGIASGELDSQYASEELTTAIFGQILFYGITQAIQSNQPWRRQRARRVVQLFMKGASKNPKEK